MTQRALQRGLTATPSRGATDWPAFACEPAGDTLPNLRSMQHSTAFLYLSSFEALRIIFNAFGPTFCAETQPCPVFRKKDATLSGHSLSAQNAEAAQATAASYLPPSQLTDQCIQFHTIATVQ